MLSPTISGASAAPFCSRSQELPSERERFNTGLKAACHAPSKHQMSALAPHD